MMMSAAGSCGAAATSAVAVVIASAIIATPLMNFASATM
jgi:hypothetical protein